MSEYPPTSPITDPEVYSQPPLSSTENPTGEPVPGDTSQPATSSQATAPEFLDDRPQPEQLVYEWSAPSRPFKKRNRQYYVTIGMICTLLSLILFFAGQFLPIAVVLAAGFLAYVLSAIPPDIVTNQITTYGIRIGSDLYYWEELGRFWTQERYQQRYFSIEVSRLPGRLTLLLADQDEQALAELLSAVLLQERPLLTPYEKAAHWFEKNIPLDIDL